MIATAETPAKTERAMRIVVVNDEAVYLQLIEAVLRDGFKDIPVLLFQDSKAAWEELSQGDCLLLIIDDKMPDLTGEEICRRLLSRGATIPIVVTSGWPLTEQLVQECASRGLNVGLLKMPFRVEALRQVMLARWPAAAGQLRATEQAVNVLIREQSEP